MAQSALDLNVWKEIAIAKQILIKAATDTLGLDPECNDDELKVELDKAMCLLLLINITCSLLWLSLL